MHGFESVVGPVKGVFDKETSLNKAREHSLLRSDRPAYVTILSLGMWHVFTTRAFLFVPQSFPYIKLILCVQNPNPLCTPSIDRRSVLEDFKSEE